MDRLLIISLLSISFSSVAIAGKIIPGKNVNHTWVKDYAGCYKTLTNNGAPVEYNGIRDRSGIYAPYYGSTYRDLDTDEKVPSLFFNIFLGRGEFGWDMASMDSAYLFFDRGNYSEVDGRYSFADWLMQKQITADRMVHVNNYIEIRKVSDKVIRLSISKYLFNDDRVYELEKIACPSCVRYGQPCLSEFRDD